MRLPFLREPLRQRASPLSSDWGKPTPVVQVMLLGSVLLLLGGFAAIWRLQTGHTFPSSPSVSADVVSFVRPLEKEQVLTTLPLALGKDVSLDSEKDNLPKPPTDSSAVSIDSSQVHVVVQAAPAVTPVVPVGVPTSPSSIVPTPSPSPPSSTAPTPTQPAKEQPVPASMHIRFSIGGPKPSQFTVDAPTGSTVEQVMQIARKKKLLSYTTSGYSGLGSLVEGINGVQQDTKAALYWSYKINGVYASLGVSSQNLKDGDFVYWRYGPAPSYKD